MVSAQEIRFQLGLWLQGELTWEQFDDWFGANTWNAHQWGNEETNKLVDFVAGTFGEWSSEVITKAEAKREITKFIRQYAQCQPVFGVGRLGPLKTKLNATVLEIRTSSSMQHAVSSAWQLIVGNTVEHIKVVPHLHA